MSNSCSCVPYAARFTSLNKIRGTCLADDISLFGSSLSTDGFSANVVGIAPILSVTDVAVTFGTCAKSFGFG